MRPLFMETYIKFLTLYFCKIY